MKKPAQLLKMKHEGKPLTEEELIAADIYEIQQERAHWIDMSNNGCADPAFPDGVNLNLCRNHIARTGRAGAPRKGCVHVVYSRRSAGPADVAGGRYYEMRMKHFRKEYGDSLVIDSERQLKLF